METSGRTYIGDRTGAQMRQHAQKTSGAGPQPGEPALAGLIAQAVELHRASRLPEAEGLYRDVLAIDPHNADALHLLGVIAHQCGQHAAAIELIEQAIAQKPREPEFHSNLGLAYQALKRNDDAIRHFKRAFAINPKSALAARNLGAALLRAGRTEDAINAAASSLMIDETPEAKDLLSQCLHMPHRATGIVAARDMILRAVEKRWARPDLLARTASDLVAQTGTLAKTVRRAEMAWPELLPCSDIDLLRAQSDRLLQALLISTPICRPALEHYLTSVRAALLERALSTPEDVSLLPLACALAHQCFTNEYVFCLSESETARLASLSETINSALAASRSASPFQVAVLAAYTPLYVLPAKDTLPAADWAEPLNAVITQQVREPAIEHELRDSIPRLTPIMDSISRAVQEQYEDHPYPRWSQIASHLLPQPEIAQAQDILIAGCGTGRHPIETAMCNTNARVLAIDLSLASLSYAVRKAREAGIVNIEFAQADILELGSLDRTFDYIDSSGVLHHMADPWAGWRSLIAVLRPGGIMRIGLYSELARSPYAAIRSFIKERGYSGSTDDIRRFRQEAFQRPELASALPSSDFYSTSNCRDLLFHVHEQRMTIPQIKEFLAQHDLEFIGFAAPDVVHLSFQQRFPGKDRTDLDCWHVFEQEHPSIFITMYQFGVRKR